jgi:GTP:adenosylcobinamide-phosphate guanylyltransferase
MIYQFSLFDNWISNRNTDANKRLKHAQILFHSQNNTHYHQNIGKLAESKNVHYIMTIGFSYAEDLRHATRLNYIENE